MSVCVKLKNGIICYIDNNIKHNDAYLSKFLVQSFGEENIIRSTTSNFQLPYPPPCWSLEDFPEENNV